MQRIKDKFWYVRLSPNHKVFHYGDCDEKSIPSIDDLPIKLAVVDIRGLLTGRDCPHMKDLRGRKTTHQLAFSLILDSAESSNLDFVAPDEAVYDYWVDGINALLGMYLFSSSIILIQLCSSLTYYTVYFGFVNLLFQHFFLLFSGHKMTSKKTENDLEILLSMDIKLRLLDAEGIDIPQDPPLIPEPPSNYDFCYELK